MTTCLGIRNATHWADARSIERISCYDIKYISAKKYKLHKTRKLGGFSQVAGKICSVLEYLWAKDMYGRSTTSWPLSLRGQAPSYLVDDCQLIADSGRPQLHSAHAIVLTVPRTNTRLGNRSFSVAGPRIWNSLPTSLWQPDIEFGHFKRLLKAFLFGETAAH